MTLRRMWIMAVVCAVGIPSFTLAQTVCGDANQSGMVTMIDIVRIYDYVGLGPNIVPISASADCDNRAGITISDAQTLGLYFFSFENRLDCVIQSSYGFSPSLADTVFLPFMTAIPDGLDSVKLPVITSLAVDTRAFYIPCRGYETNGPGRFQLTRVDAVDVCPLGYGRQVLEDTAVLLGQETDEAHGDLTGRHTYFSMVFKRNQPGLADIACTDVVRSTTLRIAVEKNGDLFTPVVMYYEVPLPHPVVTASLSSLNITAEAGYWSTLSYQVTFTSDLWPVSFNLATSDGWIVIDDPSPTGYTTPATITVRANASILDPGDYAGQLVVSDMSPADAEFIPAAVDVTLTVTEPLVHPPGDLNCDGRVSISDIVLMVDCLFINARPVPTCH